MIPLIFPMLSVAQMAQLPVPTPAPTPQEIIRPQAVLALPGRLDSVPVFNSNSPELVLKEGILLSTFPAQGKATPSAHLNYAFKGRFDLFAHHIARGEADNLTTLYLGVIVQNPGIQPVTVEVLQGASYLSQPDAPFIDLPTLVENPEGKVYAGPGSRAMDTVMRGQRQDSLPAQVVIPPGGYRMLLNLPIPVRELKPPLNGRSTLLRLRSSGPVYLASLALFAKSELTQAEQAKPNAVRERAPNLEEWQALLERGELSSPRDRPPTPLDAKGGIIYGRVAGVSQGSTWRGTLVTPGQINLRIPGLGQAVSYGLSTLHGGRQGTGQIQTAAMLARYPDTAYQAHGNYGIEYNLALPLFNPTPSPQRVVVALETPIKEDVLSKNGLRFFDPLPKSTFFRGPVRVRYRDDRGRAQTRYVHVVQKRGQQGEPLVELTLPPRKMQSVQVDFLYPPDATPPQVLTIRTLAN